MPDEPNFMDLVTLLRVKPDSTVERFGSAINSSFFDASNILGTLKQKGLIDFTTMFGSQNSIVVTDLGKQLIGEAEAKAPTLFDHLDMEVLKQLSGGKRSITDLSGAVNVRPKDLALHIYKLSMQQYLDYELSSGKLSIMLTEKGFMQVKQGMPAQAAQQGVQLPPQQQAQQAQPTPPMQQPQAQSTAASAPPQVTASGPQAYHPQQQAQQIQQTQAAQKTAGASKAEEFPELDDLEKKIRADRNKRRTKSSAMVAVIIIILILLVLVLKGII